MNNSVLSELVQLETELHLNSTRKNLERMHKLLHKDFREIGRSGKEYSRDEILRELQGEAELPEIHASDFDVQELGEELYLLTYTSAHVSGQEDKELHRFTRRASVWVRENQRWQIRFHQGSAIPD